MDSDPGCLRLLLTSFFRDSNTGRPLYVSLWTYAASTMMFSTIMEVSNGVYYGVCIYSRVPNLGSYPSRDDLHDGGLGRLFRLSPSLLGSTR